MQDNTIQPFIRWDGYPGISPNFEVSPLNLDVNQLVATINLENTSGQIINRCVTLCKDLIPQMPLQQVELVFKTLIHILTDEDESIDFDNILKVLVILLDSNLNALVPILLEELKDNGAVMEFQNSESLAIVRLYNNRNETDIWCCNELLKLIGAMLRRQMHLNNDILGLIANGLKNTLEMEKGRGEYSPGQPLIDFNIFYDTALAWTECAIQDVENPLIDSLISCLLAEQLNVQTGRINASFAPLSQAVVNCLLKYPSPARRNRLAALDQNKKFLIVVSLHRSLLGPPNIPIQTAAAKALGEIGIIGLAQQELQVAHSVVTILMESCTASNFLVRHAVLQALEELGKKVLFLPFFQKLLTSLIDSDAKVRIIGASIFRIQIDQYSSFFQLAEISGIIATAKIALETALTTNLNESDDARNEVIYLLQDLAKLFVEYCNRLSRS